MRTRLVAWAALFGPPWIALVLVLLALAMAPPARAESWTIERQVVADDFTPPTGLGPERRCPAGLDRPTTGERVRLVVTDDRARRDEGAVSFIVRLDSGTALFLHHRSATYSELPYAVGADLPAGPFRASLGDEADEYLGFRIEGTVRAESRHVAETSALVRSATVGNRLGRRLDVEAHLAPNQALAAAALAVEGLAQAVRRSGEEWLAVLEPGDAIPLTLKEATHQPFGTVSYSEVFSGLRQGPVEPGVFDAPADYREVEYQPGCYPAW